MQATHDGGMIASSAFVTCTAFRPWLTAILDISLESRKLGKLT
jgi:hypothetical protein